MTNGLWSGLITVVLLATFLGGVAWAWSGRRRTEFNQAARMPLEDDGDAKEGEDRP
jgi:cytochrome c oxidase cbb3-type subunit 4